MANAGQWRAFQQQLDGMKRRYRFRVFHAKDFKAGSGEFRGWSAEKCWAFIMEFGRASANLMEVVTVTLPNEAYGQHYRRTPEDPRRLRLDTPYALCFRLSLTHLLIEAYRRLGHHRKFNQTVLHVIAESGHRNAGDAKRVFDEMKLELKDLGGSILGNLAFADKDECDALMLADYAAFGTLKLETAGENNECAPSAPLDRRVTGWTQLTCTAEGLAAFKAKLIDGVKRDGRWAG